MNQILWLQLNGARDLQIQNWFLVGFHSFLPRLRGIVTCIVPIQKILPNLYLYLFRRYTICHFPIVVSYLCIGQNQKNQPNLDLYLVGRYKICHFPIVVLYPCISQTKRTNIIGSVSGSEIQNICIGRNLVGQKQKGIKQHGYKRENPAS